mmetsp:Transcript_5571/g.12043  ORF Transcript_5571/g.12043 Transcript_5571/m.12043 type:complete len:325 (+) Transcript_5571:230-1204(+)
MRPQSFPLRSPGPFRYAASSFSLPAPWRLQAAAPAAGALCPGDPGGGTTAPSGEDAGDGTTAVLVHCPDPGRAVALGTATCLTTSSTREVVVSILLVQAWSRWGKVTVNWRRWRVITRVARRQRWRSPWARHSTQRWAPRSAWSWLGVVDAGGGASSLPAGSVVVRVRPGTAAGSATRSLSLLSACSSAATTTTRSCPVMAQAASLTNFGSLQHSHVTTTTATADNRPPTSAQTPREDKDLCRTNREVRANHPDMEPTRCTVHTGLVPWRAGRLATGNTSLFPPISRGVPTVQSHSLACPIASLHASRTRLRSTPCTWSSSSSC